MTDLLLSLREFTQFIDKFSEQLIRFKQQVTDVYKLNPEGNERLQAINSILKDLNLPTQTHNSSAVISWLPGTRAASTVVLKVAVNETNYTGMPTFAQPIIETSIGLGVLTVLHTIQENCRNQLKVIFEFDSPPCNATALLHRKVLHDALTIWGLNINPDIPTGGVGVKFGAVLPAKDEFSLKIYRKTDSSSAGMQPNIIQATAQIITSLNQSFTRKINPLTPLQVTFSSIRTVQSDSGTTDAIMLQGSFQTIHAALLHEIPGILQDILQGVARAYGLDFHVEMMQHTPPVSNDEQITHNLKKSAEDILGRNNVYVLEYPYQLAADFSEYLRRLPGSVLEIGVAPQKENPGHIDCAIQTGIRVLTRAFLQQES